ncbi:hypothetical protein K503DRAFT_855999 [Rhizopogon vinicolor AM-OR11-026]|uniref:Uncharacterized protein n=1 Tax=Rhizopogon vinicolor AM-OR11-026 TaxID=1314800 RepID=A0A1B7N3P9_9AGAM|nr:hypothetical protein K503DRAFT_855999 [Rhizopogon vinicolor AM-OR11-026]
MCMRGTPHPALLFTFSLFASGESVHHAAILTRREVPEIGGSQGGFIGLVVALSVLILICCIAVFLLLRNHEPSEQDRAARRERYHRRYDRREHNTTSTQGISSFGEKLRGMWAKGSSSGRSGSRRGGRGWIQAGSGDEWETDSDRDDERGAQPMQPFPKPVYEAPYTGRIQETDSPLSDTTSALETYTPARYTSPYEKDSSRKASPQGSPLPLSSSPILPRHEADIEDDDEEVLPHGHRHFSTQSSTSVRTFEGGTKFIESF